jgi:hypothetical protein
MSLFDKESEASKSLRLLVIGGRQDLIDLTERARGAKKRIGRKDSLQHTRYPVTTLELILFVIFVSTFIVLTFLCLYFPLGSEPHL